MQVFAINKDGVRVDAAPHGDGTFKCFPKSENRLEHARSFATLREAAAFLVANSDWGIRMNPGWGIIYENIQIVRR